MLDYRNREIIVVCTVLDNKDRGIVVKMYVDGVKRYGCEKGVQDT